MATTIVLARNGETDWNRETPDRNRGDQRARDAWVLATSDPEPDPLADALIELGRELSPDARWALVNTAGLTEGATETTAPRVSERRRHP